MLVIGEPTFIESYKISPPHLGEHLVTSQS